MNSFGIIGSGSWATAIAKILTDKGHAIGWWVRDEASIRHIKERGHNPRYLPAAGFHPSLLHLSPDVKEVVAGSDILVIAVPSAYVEVSLQGLSADNWRGKKVISAIKGLIPGKNILLNQYLEEEFGIPLQDYFAVLGPCHAEEVAAEKLSYLTFSGADIQTASRIASHFATPYINTIVNHDIMGVQYAAVLKNIYALGAGMAHGLEYGDNFLSVYIANAADEMAGLLRNSGVKHNTVGEKEGEDQITHRNTYGNMIGKGYSVKAAQLEMNMVAEGYNASKCIYEINRKVEAGMPIAETIYKILWEDVKASDGFKRIEQAMA